MQLAAYLKSKNITPQAFADAIGVHRTSVVRFCSGERRPDLTTLQKIHEATGGDVTPQDFFAGESSQSGEAA